MTEDDAAAVVRMHEDDPRWQSPAQPHGLTRLQREPDPANPDPDADAGLDGLGAAAEVWTVRRPGEPWAGAAVQRWCADCPAWTHVVDAGVPVDWYVDDRCATCGRGSRWTPLPDQLTSSAVRCGAPGPAADGRCAHGAAAGHHVGSELRLGRLIR